ncbi:54S ribosomal protein L22, mitochondrial [Boothiomyces sp. JEL0838]|nr:54S ribosomal protein L22, mitochondrial [Boothiomyces sp. JEL0838]
MLWKYFRIPRRFNTTGTSSLFDAAISEAKPLKSSKPIPTFTTGNMRTSPQKLNHLARLIRNMTLDEAEAQMRNVLKKRGLNVAQMIKRVGHVLNHNYNQDKKEYYIKRAWVGKGAFLKRMRIMGRGRHGVMHRPHAHLKIQIEKIKPKSDIDELLKKFKKDLFIQVQDTKPVYPIHPVWSSKPWKYVTSDKWVDPKNALIRRRD